MASIRVGQVSEDTVWASWNAGAEASPIATWACPVGWLDDFSDDLRRIDVPARIEDRDRGHPAGAERHHPVVVRRSAVTARCA